MSEASLVISRMRPDSSEARVLIDALDAELRQRYPETTDVHGLHTQDADDPRLIFLVARIADRSVGCGAVRELEPGVGEVKRMFVEPSCRGRGIARQILMALEAAARASGYLALRLETGTRQPEAIRLYRSAGYREIPLYGEYVGNLRSLCFEKQLA
jgi:GNAT superfamily N-acetyltransferase